MDELKSKLKHLLTEGLDQALQYMAEVLSSQSPQYNAYLSLRGRYTTYLTERIQGVRSNAELDVLYNRLLADFLALVDCLSPSDLRGTEPPQPPQRPKRGHLLYHIPNAMALEREHACRVRIAYQQEHLLVNWKERTGQTQQSIRVAEIMAVEMLNVLESAPFHLRSISETIQFLDEADYTEWLFYVRPLQEGAFPLLLKISVIEIIGGRELRKDVVIEEQVVVSNVVEEYAEGFRSLGFEMTLYAHDKQGWPGEKVMEPPLLSKEVLAMPPPSAAPRAAPHGRRSPALLLLAFVACALGLTWSLTTRIQRDYWAAAWRDTEVAYTTYVNEHKDNPAFFFAPQCEKAYFRRIELSDNPLFVRKYLEKFGHSPLATPERREYAEQRLHTLEQAWVERLRTTPTSENIQEYVRQFPEMNLLPEVLTVLRAHPQRYLEQLDLLEQAVVQQAQTDTLTPHRREFLRHAWPDNERVQQAVEAQQAERD